jgi:hypothetical protein
MRHCDGRLFDGSACNNDLFDCGECSTSGCYGDGCDNQRFLSSICECGAALSSDVLATAAA